MLEAIEFKTRQENRHFESYYTQINMDYSNITRNDLRLYFSNEDWNSMSDYEIDSCFHRLQNYHALINLGFSASKPEFMEQNVLTGKQAKKSGGNIIQNKKAKPLEEEKGVNIQVVDKARKVTEQKMQTRSKWKTVNANVNQTETIDPVMLARQNFLRNLLRISAETKVKEDKPTEEGPHEKGRLIFSETETRNAISLHNFLNTALRLCKLYRKQGINILKELKKDYIRNKKTLKSKHKNKAIKSRKEDRKKFKRVEKKPTQKKITKIETQFLKKESNKIKNDNGKTKKNENDARKIKLVNRIPSEDLKSVTDKGPSSNHRYPKRNIPIKSYTEEDVPNDDEYIFCDACDREWPGDCPEHGPLIHLADRKIAKDVTDFERAIKTTPPQLEVSNSEILGGGIGVWTKCVIPPRVLLGPYDGHKSSTPDETGYSWRIMKNRRVLHYVSGECAGSSNWMRYVNSARYESELNLFAFQYKSEMYYRTFKHIPPKSELKVWYGKEYNIKLGITPENFKNPNMELIKNVVFPCGQCSALFTSPLYLDSHRKYCSARRHLKSNWSKGNKSVSCPDQAIVSNSHTTEGTQNGVKHVHISKECIKDSVLRVDGKKWYNSDVCKYKTVNSCSITKHMRVYTGENPIYTCDKCNYRCIERRAFKQHMAIHTGEKPYGCDKCSYRCIQLSSLKTHMATHTGEKPYGCDKCSYRCIRHSDLKNHMATHTGEKPYGCDKCSYRSIRHSDLKKHMATHTGEKPYGCDKCSFRCITLAHLKRHMATHTGEKPYGCDKCSYRCIQISNLKTHMATHTGEKPYGCDKCSYRCIQLSSLKTHMATHTGEKPYGCDKCSYRCIQLSSLKRHMATHTGEKPYGCDKCSFRCITLSNLKRHMSTHNVGKR